jgi:hypothetical protein
MTDPFRGMMGAATPPDPLGLSNVQLHVLLRIAAALESQADSLARIEAHVRAARREGARQVDDRDRSGLG